MKIERAFSKILLVACIDISLNQALIGINLEQLFAL